MKHLFFILLFIPFILKAQEPTVGNLSRSLKMGGATLAKDWKYQVGDHPEWANPDFDDSSWQTFSNTNLYNKEIQKKVSKATIVWFRKRISIDSTTTQKLKLILLQTGASEIFLDGQLIHSLGKVSSNPDSVVPFKADSGPLSFPMEINKEQVLAVRFANKPNKNSLLPENSRRLTILVQKEGFKQELRGNELARGFVRLVNDWKIKIGDNPNWALPNYNDSLWQTAFDPIESLNELYEKGKTPSIVWLRKEFKTDSTIKPDVIAQVFQSGASEIYLNGELIHKLGRVHNDPDSVVPKVVTTNSAIKNLSFPVQKQQEYTLAIRFVDHQEHLPLFSKRSTAFFNSRISTLEFASNAEDVRESQKFFIGYYLVLGTISFMFILFLALFLYFPSQKINLYFSLSSLLFAVYIVESIRSEYVSLFTIQDILLTNLSITGYLVLLYLSFYKAFGQKLGRLFWVIVSFGILISPLDLLFEVKFDQISLFAVLLISDFVRICLQALKQNNRAALVLLLLSLVNALYLVALLVNALSIISAPQIFRYYPFSLLIMPVGLAFYLGYSFGHTNQTLRKKLEEINDLSEEKQQILTDQNSKLEKLVNERTSDLKQSLEDLKAAQSQLIQSEKMASLGELTAGIAHEIQNPLNFVNNFSEVNAELIGEMEEEIDKGNLDEAKKIAGSIRENQQKINHHGKRADSIVKGMLQHSRSSSGIKELTDINKLADEFLRLAYHGLRAKDKSFNATMQSDFDRSIGKIRVASEEIGRVILNLLNNAFYAVSEKKRLNPEGYEPTVSISTNKDGDQVEIKVQDNGNGIPQNVLDKIFQPFFTTKPTGQGTGLGLSLAYDIVKAHGGELKVETKEGEGSVFYIQLPI